jgi:hypothetical protein
MTASCRYDRENWAKPCDLPVSLSQDVAEQLKKVQKRHLSPRLTDLRSGRDTNYVLSLNDTIYVMVLIIICENPSSRFFFTRVT